MTWLKNFLNHERYTAIGLLLSVCLIIWITACESKVRSIRYPDHKLTRDQIQAELDSYLAQYDYSIQRLDQQDKIKNLLLENALLVSQGGVFNPYALIPSIAALLGVGATVDRVRAVKKKKNNS